MTDPFIVEYEKQLIESICKRAEITPEAARQRLTAYRPKTILNLFFEGLSADQAAARIA